MAWFGESLSSLTGHLQNLTKEVLSEASDESKGPTGDLKATKEKLEELEAVCSAQDLEISALKKQNAELRRRLEQAGALEEEGQVVLPPTPTTWLSIEQRCDAGYIGGTNGRGSTDGSARGHTRALSDATAVAAKHQERLEKELKERIQLIEHLQIQLQKVEEERHVFSLRTYELEQEIQQLKKHTQDKSLVKNKDDQVLQSEDKLIHENNELKSQLNEANKRTSELEEELLIMRNQCLDHVIDSQVNTSELRLDVEQTRKRIANEAGIQRAEKLRAHQDMVNRMIQMGEKSQENEQSLKKLQAEDKKLAAEMAVKIQKLGDQEQQDLIHGTLKALELENQVLNLRNAQLEKESIKELGMKSDQNKYFPEEVGYRSRSEVSKFQDVGDIISLQSELADLTMLNQRLENQVTQLQNQIEVYKGDIKHHDMLSDEMSRDKLQLEQQVISFKKQLQEKEKLCNSSFQGLSSLPETLVLGKAGSEESLGKNKELEEELVQLKRTLYSLQEEKHCLEQEIEAMARVVQDLEAKVSNGVEERKELESSIEELDQQHQDAIEKLLGLRNAELAEIDLLKSQIEELRLAKSFKLSQTDRNVQANLLPSVLEDYTQTNSVHQYDQEVQTDLVQHNKFTSTEYSDKERNGNESESVSKYDRELSEKINKIINFELPDQSSDKEPRCLHLVQEIVKVANDSKWKKDTLERKVAELIRENNELKSTVTIFETECCNLRDNVERLAEQLVGLGKSNGDTLPTILENSEEMDVLEQKNAVLEEEITVLRETRLNLEQDAVRMREERDYLLGRIRNLEAQLKNHENIGTELQRHVEDAENSIQAFKAAAENSDRAKQACENRAKSLVHDLEVTALNHEKQLTGIQEHAMNLEKKNGELSKDIAHTEKELKILREKMSEMVSEKDSLLQFKTLHSEQFEKLIEENETLKSKIADFQLQLQEVSKDLEVTVNNNLDLQHQLDITSKNLQVAQSKEEYFNLQNAKFQNTFESFSKLQEENTVLRQRVTSEELKFEILIREKEELEKEMGNLKGKIESELIWINNEQLSTSYDELNSEITSLKNEKAHLEQSLESAIQQQDFLKLECESQQSQILQMEQIEVQLRESISSLHKQANEMDRRIQARYESEFLGKEQRLKDEIESLKNNITVLEHNESNIAHQIEHINSLESQLSVVMKDNEALIEENTELRAALSDSPKNVSIRESNDFQNTNSVNRTQMHPFRNDTFDVMKVKLEDGEQKTFDLVEEKVQEITILEIKLKELSVSLDESAKKIKILEDQNVLLTNEKLQCQEKFEMTKETVSNLSGIIKEKDRELVDMKEQLSQLNGLAERVSDLNKQLQQAQEFRSQSLREHEQLLETVHSKHRESVQYHAEIQRLSSLLSQELAKNQQLTAEYTALVQQSNEERASTSPKHQQELKELQNLIEVKDNGLKQLCNRLELKEQELQARGMEIETLQHQMSIMSQERAQQISAAAVNTQDEDLQDKYKELLSKLQDEQRRLKNAQNELETCQGRETSLQKELERLRIHLVEIEDTYTQEALKSEERVKELANKLQQAEEMMMSSSTVYKSANIRANQQVETLQEQARLIAQQRDDVQLKLSAAEDQVAKHSAALRNLQAVLEQFQRDKEREIETARASVYLKVEAAQKRNDELLSEISSLKMQLKEAKEGLSAASRLGEELEKKTEVVNRLKQEVVQLEDKALKAEEKVKIVGQTVEGKVDKSLVKNVVLGFFLAPSNSKEQVLHVVASVLDFNEDEKGRIQKVLGLHSSDGSGGWFKSLLHPSGSDQRGNTQSLSEAFVRFLESESIPQPRLKMLPKSEKPSTSNSNSPRATTPVSAQRKSPLLLADMQLPTFAQFPVGRNSSSILKDILKES